jgi:hypothetical protein
VPSDFIIRRRGIETLDDWSGSPFFTVTEQPQKKIGERYLGEIVTLAV